jgi:hypothetical protein
VSQRYLRVKKWDEFQHGTKKRLPWIKLYDKLLEDYHFARLTEVEQLHLIKIWLLANRVGNKIPHDAAWVRSMIRSARNPNLTKFIKEGFLEKWSAAKETAANEAIAARQSLGSGETQASPDREVERDKEPPTPFSAKERKRLERWTRTAVESNLSSEEISEYLSRHCADDVLVARLLRVAEEARAA